MKDAETVLREAYRLACQQLVTAREFIFRVADNRNLPVATQTSAMHVLELITSKEHPAPEDIDQPWDAKPPHVFILANRLLRHSPVLAFCRARTRSSAAPADTATATDPCLPSRITTMHCMSLPRSFVRTDDPRTRAGRPRSRRTRARSAQPRVALISAYASTLSTWRR